MPAAKGVYTFVVEPGIADHPAVHYLMYVGMTDKQDFRRRYAQYLREPSCEKRREHIAQLIEKWPNHLWFYYAELPQGPRIGRLESSLLAAYLPPLNDEFPAEVRRTIKRVFR